MLGLTYWAYKAGDFEGHEDHILGSDGYVFNTNVLLGSGEWISLGKHKGSFAKSLARHPKLTVKILLCQDLNHSNKMIFKPWIVGEPLDVSRYGILEPKNSKKEIIPDLIMVPLVAFDNQLNRIGYGKGYYDRSLKKFSKSKNKIVRE